ncbi:unnamed protein product [Brugia pahangi]|uniref:Uncharacterized protein n=1 Tax=Brugia pahangi TaxID=6280 RepID=A0A0N4SYE2_BRUPA|nr:unnamed protein product [Brugia pahangi]
MTWGTTMTLRKGYMFGHCAGCGHGWFLGQILWYKVRDGVCFIKQLWAERLDDSSICRPNIKVRRSIYTSESLRTSPEFPLASSYLGIVHFRVPEYNALPPPYCKQQEWGCVTPRLLPNNLRICWTPWSVFQDGSDR